VRIARARISGFGSSESCGRRISDWKDWLGTQGEAYLVDLRYASHTLLDRDSTYFDKRVHGEDDELWLCLCIVHEVEVD
jgi:hypothetical protein